MSNRVNMASWGRAVIALMALIGISVSASLEAQKLTGPSLADLKTTAESSDYKSTSTYDDVVKFMKAVDALSPIVYYSTYGTTTEGRAMPIAIVGTGLKATTPAAVKATGKLRVHIQANIHAGEVEGKESAQALLREFAMGQHKDWLQTMVFLITPIFNADGNEKFAMNNRGPQNGPINGQGTRAAGLGLNINRDFMKLETPEAKAFVTLWNDYDPHVGFDLHTSDGSITGYHLTYSPALNPNTNKAIVDLQKNEWFPFVTKEIKAKHGWDTYYYGNVSGGARGAGRGRVGAPGTAASAPPVPEVVGAEIPAAPAPPQVWATFEHVPRFHNNYVGLRNRFAMLSEAYAYATFKDRILATNYFLEESLNFAHANAAKIKAACAKADAEMLAGKTLATRATIKRGPEMIDILMGEVEDELNPNNGARMNRRTDVTKVVPMLDGRWFEPALTDTAATEYYIPATATKAIALLNLHGVKMRTLTAAIPAAGAANIEEFAISANTQRPANAASIDTGTHGLRALEGAWQASTTAVPAGSFAVSMAQPLARLAFYLIAPTSDDGVVAWNFEDDLLGSGVKTAPIWRKRVAPAIPADAKARMDAQLTEAYSVWDRDKSNADAQIWVGRRTAYLGKFEDAIAIFSDGIKRHPADARFYRHRGHRYLTMRNIDLAIADFEKAVELTRGTPDQIEPDGQPNARNTPTSSLQSNIWYHLGLGNYLKGDFNGAAAAWANARDVLKNDDNLVAASAWLYVSLRRAGRPDDAARVLTPIRANLNVIENGSYLSLLLLHKGERTEADILGVAGAGSAGSAVRYGVSAWHLVNGRTDRAREMWTAISAAPDWPSFGVLAAETELARIK